MKKLNPVKSFVFVWLILIVFAAPSFGFGTDPSGRALKRYVEEYLQNADFNDALAAKIKESGGANSMGVFEFLCSIEVANALSDGYSVWENRRAADKYYMDNHTRSQFIPLNIMNYCMTYSKECGHWEWNAKCLEKSSGKNRPGRRWQFMESEMGACTRLNWICGFQV